ncbi:alpha/beta hydrolase [Pedobacter xixiisoli]|uniref:Acetyl esterase/lipase n=1 Tax=Pedobacter xixiisoli TaxID=1476464 RepID=A0A286A0B5_9SPHI|nr:alpha/beta hydrolase fold domain-containing protein [Pedobacter xixiisoli]SOD15340.1 Acetyl esterase/lipase [Pedobacter xixiisoli]
MINTITIPKSAMLLMFLFFNTIFSVFGQQQGYLESKNISYYKNNLLDKDKKERCVLDVYYPKDMKSFTTVIWFHGGGLTGGNKEIPTELKDKNICVVGVGYRLSPMVKSPAYIEDAAAAVAWVFNNIDRFGGDKSKIFIAGMSAGAYLANMITLDKSWMEKHAIDANKLAGLISFSGHTITHFTIRQEKKMAATKVIVDELAPLYHVRPDAPPILLITGDRELELLGRYEENAYLMRMLKETGHKDVKLLEIQGYGHDMDKPAYRLLLSEIERINKLNNLKSKK